MTPPTADQGSEARETRITDGVDALCGRGWDAPSTATLARAEQFLKANPELCRDDFVLACATGELDVVRERLDADATLATRELGPRSWQPLVYVAYSVLAKRHDERAERITQVGALLLERGASANSGYRATGSDGATHSFPVLYACIHVSDNPSLAERLLEAGADPNDDQSLYHAVERFDTRWLDRLHRHGLKPELLSYCMLHQIDLGYLEGVRWFLDHGADPNVKHPNGHSALHWAIMRPGSSQLIELLLERGADARATTRAGLSAIDLAERHHGKVEVVPELERRGSTRGARTPLDEVIIAAAHGDEARARELFDANPGLLSTLPWYDRARVSAFAEAGNQQGAVILARLGFDTAAPSWMGMTPLHWAACRGNPQMLRELLAAGAPFLDVPGFRTPLHSALHQRWASFGWRPGESDYAGVVSALLESGVRVPDDLQPCGDAAIDALIATAFATTRSEPSTS